MERVHRYESHWSCVTYDQTRGTSKTSSYKDRDFRWKSCWTWERSQILEPDKNVCFLVNSSLVTIHYTTAVAEDEELNSFFRDGDHEKLVK